MASLFAKSIFCRSVVITFGNINMKKGNINMKIFLNASIFMTILCAVVFSGCATTQQNQQNVNNITLEGTLQKSAEILHI
jgi:hypothetical protein